MTMAVDLNWVRCIDKIRMTEQFIIFSTDNVAPTHSYSTDTTITLNTKLYISTINTDSVDTRTKQYGNKNNDKRKYWDWDWQSLLRIKFSPRKRTGRSNEETIENLWGLCDRLETCSSSGIQCNCNSHFYTWTENMCADTRVIGSDHHRAIY